MIRKHFLSKGFVQANQKSKDELLFEEDDHLVSIRVVNKEKLSDRNALLKEILDARQIEEETGRTYLALPNRYVAAIDGGILRDNGIGLIAYGEDDIREVVPAKHILHTREILTSEGTDALRYEIEELKRLYSEARDNISRLNDEVESLKSKMHSVAIAKEKARGVIEKNQFLESQNEEKNQAGTNLPAYFLRNPWLNVLSKRGKEKVAGEGSNE
jgi:hypothetical protein